MKTAVSIPNKLLAQVERLARGTGRSRSEVFVAALKEYVARHAPDAVTEAMNEVCERFHERDESFVRVTAHSVLARSAW